MSLFQAPALNKTLSRGTFLSSHSTYEIGGEAGYFAMPETSGEISLLLETCNKSGLPFTFFGMGSNILFPDEPKTDKLYISLKKYLEIELYDDKLYLSAGIPLSLLSLIGLAVNDSRFAFTYLLPGCFGAAIYMNAKYGNFQTCDLLDTIYYADIEKNGFGISRLKADDCGFAYKKSIFQEKGYIITGAEIVIHGMNDDKLKLIDEIISIYKASSFNLSSLNDYYLYFSSEAKKYIPQKSNIFSLYEEIENYRLSKKHFEFRSCGSIFKNNYAFGIPMGKVIENLGLKGISHGGALISRFHGNMILNMNRAKASDVLYLMNMISERVFEAHGFLPEPEVVVIKE